MEWQPIETAPKDGEAIFCFWAGESVVTHRNYGIAMWDRGSWVSAEDPEIEYTDPSSWAPLPPPPGQSQEDGR